MPARLSPPNSPTAAWAACKSSRVICPSHPEFSLMARRTVPMCMATETPKFHSPTLWPLTYLSASNAFKTKLIKHLTSKESFLPAHHTNIFLENPLQFPLYSNSKWIVMCQVSGPILGLYILQEFCTTRKTLLLRPQWQILSRVKLDVRRWRKAWSPQNVDIMVHLHDYMMSTNTCLYPTSSVRKHSPAPSPKNRASGRRPKSKTTCHRQ